MTVNIVDATRLSRESNGSFDPIAMAESVANHVERQIAYDTEKEKLAGKTVRETGHGIAPSASSHRRYGVKVGSHTCQWTEKRAHQVPKAGDSNTDEQNFVSKTRETGSATLSTAGQTS